MRTRKLILPATMAEEDDKHILEAASKLPLSEQAQHKDWKVRTQAFETIEKTCSTAVGADDPALADLGEHQLVSLIARLHPHTVYSRKPYPQERKLFHGLLLWHQIAKTALSAQEASLSKQSAIPMQLLLIRCWTPSKRIFRRRMKSRQPGEQLLIPFRRATASQVDA